MCLLAARRAPGLLLTAAGFALAHSLVPHKEGRFLLPLLAVLRRHRFRGTHTAGRPVGSGAPAWPRCLVATVASAARLPNLTLGDVGQSGFPAEESAYGLGAEPTRLLLVAHKLPDLCGLRIEGITWIFTGGYTWLHRQVPLFNAPGNLRNPGEFNYLIAPAGTPEDGVVVARDHGWTLVRLPGKGCPAGPPSWSRPTSVTD